jgi:hypothetical protein
VILPLWRAALPLALFAGLGALLDRTLRLAVHTGSDRVVQIARFTLLGVAAVFAFGIHPAVLVALLLLLLASARLRSLGPGEQGPATASPARWIRLVFPIVALLAMIRPATPLYWDEFIWLAKARLESEQGWGALHRAALDASADVIPSGYPLLWSLAASWLSAGGDSPETLAAGACAATLFCVFLYLDGAERMFAATARPRWPLAASLAVLGLSPLVFIHLRSAYVDLPLGLLAAALTFGFAADVEGQRVDTDAGEKTTAPQRITVDALIAVVLAGLKDEGFAYVVAISLVALAFALSAAGRRARHWSRAERMRIVRPIVVSTAALIPFLAWRLLLFHHHVTDSDHRLGAPDWGGLAPLFAELGHALTDWRSWGLLWPVTAGALLAVGFRRGSTLTSAGFLAAALVARGFVLLAAILCGPSRVRVFVTEGTLLNRLLMQLAPAAVGLLMLLLSAPMPKTAKPPAITPARSPG